MTWAEQVVHFRKLADRGMFDRFEEIVAQKRGLHERGQWQAADNLTADAVRMLFARGPEFTRTKVESLNTFIAPAVAAYLGKSQGDQEISVMALELTSSTNVFEILGFPIDASVLRSFGPYLARIPTSRKDPDLTPRHWVKGLTALAIGETPVWRGVAGLRPDQALTFTPGEAFGPNVQGLLGYLGAAREHGAALEDVIPAWRTFLAVADALHGASQIDFDAVLWVARIVYHHIGGEPLGRVAEWLYDESERMVAAGL